MKTITYVIEDGMFIVRQKGYFCCAHSLDQLNRYLTDHFGAGYELIQA